MKKALFFSFLILAGLMTQASEASMFTYNQATVAGEMQELDALESFVNANSDATYAELKSANNPLVANISETAGPMGTSDDLPLGIPAFFWGLVLGCVGLVIVYFVTESKDETMMALWGCLVAAVFWTVLSLLTNIASGII